MEFAGDVSASGPDVRELRVGDRVMGIVGGGAQAEYLLTSERQVVRVPDAVTDIEAGGIPEAYITAHDALFTIGSLKRGERVLIHAVGSGVGLAALQDGQIGRRYRVRFIADGRQTHARSQVWFGPCDRTLW